MFPLAAVLQLRTVFRSIISGRGYYTYLTVSAMTYRNGVMAKNWVYDSVTEITNGGGDHSEMAADVDGDGAQEIIPGARIINGDGTFRCDSGMGHGDALDVTELVPGKGSPCSRFTRV